MLLRSILAGLTVTALLAGACSSSDDDDNAAQNESATPTSERGTESTAAPEATNTPRPTNTAAPTATPTPGLPRVGETTKPLDGSTYTVNAIEDPYTSANRFIAPKPGNRYVAVDITQEATAASDESNSAYFAIQDTNDYEYQASFADKEPRFAYGDLTQGQRRRGWVIFEVPTDAKLVSVLAQTKPIGGKVVIADLQQQ